MMARSVDVPSSVTRIVLYRLIQVSLGVDIARSGVGINR
jgi:hypothetical protein